ncbi:MAG TPA: excinuclease ABC subunit UvrC [Nannocystaceae bacterium]|nr:excinuclease ABC subunit UvrC [Nannocystaceae bacterium]
MARRRRTIPDPGATLPAAPERATKSTRRSAPRPVAPEGWTPRIHDDETLEAVLERLPTEPGVYVMRDRRGEIVYVGKARSLRNRVRQYFSGHDTRVFVPSLAKLIGDIETVVVRNDKEALLLENNLIKEHRPRFNVKLRDDSNYLVLRLDAKSAWPRLELVRNVGHDGAWYFGPYHSARSARSTLRVVNRHFQLRTCTDYMLGHRARPCLQYQIGRCPAPCVYEVDRGAYGDQVADVRLFLQGRHTELIDGMQHRMARAAENLEFETAARLRDQLAAMESALQTQQIVGTTQLDQDAIGVYREGGQVEFVVLQVRQGKLLHSQSWSEKGMELPDPEVLASFLTAYFDKAAFVPDEVLLPYPMIEEEESFLAEWLRERKGRKVGVLVPERGDRKKLVLLASKNAATSFATRRDRREDTELALTRLQERLGLSKLPRIVECYDISHIQGQDTVASMVVFVDGVAEKSRYRSFRVRGVKGSSDEATLAQGYLQNDDFASMYEVLGRRFRRALANVEPGANAVEDRDDDDPWALPDLVVIDGGKGQLARVLAAMGDLGIPVGAEGVDVVALAKERKNAIGRGRAAVAKLRARNATTDPSREDESPGAGAHDVAIASEAAPEPDQALPTMAADAALPGTGWVDYVVEQVRADAEAAIDPDAFEVRPERVFVPGVKEAIVLRPGSSERYLMERVRDEAHRFAITLHRKRRGKRTLHSVLDEIDGIGPSLKKALVQHFGSIAAIRGADADELARVKGIGRSLAERIRAHLGQDLGDA